MIGLPLLRSPPVRTVDLPACGTRRYARPRPQTKEARRVETASFLRGYYRGALGAIRDYRQDIERLLKNAAASGTGGPFASVNRPSPRI